MVPASFSFTVSRPLPACTFTSVGPKPSKVEASWKVKHGGNSVASVGVEASMPVQAATATESNATLVSAEDLPSFITSI